MFFEGFEREFSREWVWLWELGVSVSGSLVYILQKSVI